MAENDDRVFRLREAVEGAFEGHRGARALLEAACGDPSAIMAPGSAESLAGRSHWTVEARGTRRHREDAFDFLS